ncbi:MAG TPA: IS110 family transposase [Rhodanobacteraceae bacterium]|jgi:transposase|nr:IS110 family transposase [Rhodanobacteraceae bacterium]
MNKITAIAIDLAKDIFQVAAENGQGEIVWEKRLKSRQAMHSFITELKPPLTVVLETGPGAQAWAREIQARGLTATILPAQHTAVHRSGNKNDARDTHAMLRALHDGHVHPVPVKTPEQLAMQALHRARRGWKRRMTAISNQVRGLLLEHGVVMAKGDAALTRTLDRVLEDASVPIPDRLRELVAELMGEWAGHRDRLRQLDGELAQLSRSDPLAKRLCEVRGVGPIISTTMACKGINADHFANCRQFAAYLGVVPTQHSSGPKVRLGHMSRRGDVYLRSALIEGAHAVIRQIPSDATDPYSRRIQRWERRCGKKGAAVRLANHNLRVIWILLKHPQAHFRSNPHETTLGTQVAEGIMQ